MTTIQGFFTNIFINIFMSEHGIVENNNDNNNKFLETLKNNFNELPSYLKNKNIEINDYTKYIIKTLITPLNKYQFDNQTRGESLYVDICEDIKEMFENKSYSFNNFTKSERGAFRPTEPNVSKYFEDSYVYKKYGDNKIAINVPKHLRIEGTIIIKKENEKVYCYDDYGKMRRRQAKIKNLSWIPIKPNSSNEKYVEEYSY